MQQMTGNRIVLRKARMSDLESVHRNIYSDPILLTNTFFSVTETLEASSERLARTIAFQKDKPIFFAALRDTDEVIGLGGIQEEAPGVFSESGIVIAQNYRRKGYGSEVLQMLLDLAFGQYHAETFVYYCLHTNIASASLARKFGFALDSCEEKPWRDGSSVLLDRYVLTRKIM